MIYPSLHRIAEQLNRNIYEKWGATINGTNEIVHLGNIADINEEKSDLQNKIIFTLIKIEEEAVLKNGAFYKKKSSKNVSKHHPAVYLNLYLLVSVTKKEYKEALQLLSDTITFFQSHKVFSDAKPGNNAEEEHPVKIIVDMYDVHFQEVFDMWSNLGNKQFPSVIYKVRLLKFFDREEMKKVPVIESVHVEYE